MKSGWVILDKDSGLFSRTAGGRIARMLGTKKYGHIGTHCPHLRLIVRQNQHHNNPRLTKTVYQTKYQNRS
ncbi:MAG: hypothetical protein IJN91_03945 [Alphaproteobacteria bacterium]|nr:hypothetical protein [Alphaproteobacteria bacterium]